MTTRKTLCLIAALATLMIGAAAEAAVPRIINFQGRLADASGTPRTGSYTMKFRFYSVSSGGTALWTDTQTVAVNSGLFNVNIGGGPTGQIPTSLTFASQYYLSIQVGSDAEMSPRFTLAAAAYAMRAEEANNAATVAGYSPGTTTGKLAINSGAVNANLNADMLDGYHWTSINKTLYTCNGTGAISSSTSGCPEVVMTSTSQKCGNSSFPMSSCQNLAVPAACPSGCTQRILTCDQTDVTCGNDGCGNYYYYRKWNRYCTCTTSGIYGYARP